MAELSNSAYVGNPPLTESDFYSMIGIGLKAPASSIQGYINGEPIFKPNSSYVVEKLPRGPSQGGRLLAGLCMALVFIIVVTATRLTLRIRRKGGQSFGLDDVAIIPAALFGIAFLSGYMYAIVQGPLGRHLEEVTYKEFAQFADMLNITGVFFYCSVFLSAISVTLFNRRLTDMTSRYWRITHNVFFGILSFILLLTIFGLSFSQLPAGVFYSSEKKGRNIAKLRQANQEELNNALLYMHITVDCMLLTVPIIIIVKSKMNRVTKVRLSFLFLLGLFHCCAAVAAQQGHIRANNEKAQVKDTTWAYVHNAGVQWNIVDITSALCVTSLPAINVLLPKTFAGEWPTRMFQRLTGLYSRMSSPASSQKYTSRGAKNADQLPDSHDRNGDIEKNIPDGSIKEKTSDFSLSSFNDRVPIKMPPIVTR